MNETYIHGSTVLERQRLALMNELINPRCLHALELNHEGLVLDVGAGTGQFTQLMADHLPSGSQIVAVERNPAQRQAALELAQSKVTETAVRCSVDYRIGDAVALPLAANEWGQFDLAHSRFLLEHVPDPLAVVRQMARAVKPGGRVVLLDDDHELMHFWPEPPGLMAAWRAYWQSYRALGNDPLIGRKLVGLLHQAGVTPSRIDHVFYGACAGETAFEGVVDNLAGVLEGSTDKVIASGQITARNYAMAIEALRQFKTRPDATVWYVINFAEGHRP